MTNVADNTLKNRFIEEIKHKIISGEWGPGKKLPGERDLAKEMGLSRTLVNNALFEMSSQGFIKMVPRAGNYVVDIQKEGTLDVLSSVMNYNSDQISLALFDDMMDTRLLIERECTSRAIHNATEEDFCKMEKNIDDMKTATNTDQFCEAVFRFHFNLIQASKNAIYMMIYRGFEPALKCLMWNHYSKGKTDRSEYICLHQNLLDALRVKDESRADEYIQLILRIGINVLRKKYERKDKSEEVKKYEKV